MIDKRYLFWEPNAWVSIRSWYHLVTPQVSPVIINHSATAQPTCPGKKQSCSVSETLQIGSKPGAATSAGLWYSSLTISWAHAGVGVIIKGMDPTCHRTAQKPQQGLLIGRGDNSPHSDVYAGVHHLVMYFYHDKNKLHAFRAQFCALAIGHNHLMNNLLLFLYIKEGVWDFKRGTLFDKAQGGHAAKDYHEKLIAKHGTMWGVTNPGSSDGDSELQW